MTIFQVISFVRMWFWRPVRIFSYLLLSFPFKLLTFIYIFYPLFCPLFRADLAVSVHIYKRVFYGCETLPWVWRARPAEFPPVADRFSLKFSSGCPGTSANTDEVERPLRRPWGEHFSFLRTQLSYNTRTHTRRCAVYTRVRVYVWK